MDIAAVSGLDKECPCDLEAQILHIGSYYL